MEFLKEKSDLWQYLKQDTRPIMIYGMGDGAEKIMRVLESIGRSVSEVFASDEFVRGHSFKGFKVQKFSEILEKYNDFVILVAFASQGAPVIDAICKLDEKYELYAPDVPVYGTNLFDMEFLNRNIDAINKVYELMEDDKSKLVFANNINFKLSGKIKYLMEIHSDKDEVYNEILKVNHDEKYVDLGAYNGDTIRELLSYTQNNYSEITAFEPDKRNFRKLSTYAEQEELRNINCHNIGAWSHEEILIFDNKGGRNSVLSQTKGKEIPVNSVDNILNGEPATYIKYDVEGSEYEAILGAEKTIKMHFPKLNVALYHRSEDIFKLPLMLHEINPNYKMYLRQHPYIPAWDTNLYCVVE